MKLFDQIKNGLGKGADDLGKKVKKIPKEYEGRCGNCHKFIGDDPYCAYCGTKAGEGDFKPFKDEMQCVYGPPPVNRTHSCKDCGFEYTTCVMIDNQRFCPQCGSSNVSISSEEGRWM